MYVFTNKIIDRLNMINFSIFVNFIKKTEKISNLSILDQGHGYWHINSKVT